MRNGRGGTGPDEYTIYDIRFIRRREDAMAGQVVEGLGRESGWEMSEFSAYLRVLADISAYLRVIEKSGGDDQTP